MLDVCLVHPEADTEASIFRFADFIVSFALLVIVYTVADVRYRFRLATAPTVFHMWVEIFVLLLAIGFTTLLTDLWLREGWLVPMGWVSAAVLRAALAAMVLGLSLSWIYHAFLFPPLFGRRTHRRYTGNLFNIVVRGLDEELQMMAVEVGLSAEALVKYAPQDVQTVAGWQIAVTDKRRRVEIINDRKKFALALSARDALLTLANRRFCRHLVKSAVTPIRIFEAISKQKKYNLSVGAFARNVSAAALADKDSLLYHEEEGFDSGLTGYVKSFSKAVYGDYHLVEGLAQRFGSPLDIDYIERGRWDAEQWEAYSRVVLLAIESYLSSGCWGQNSFALNRAIGHIGESAREIGELGSNYYSNDRAKRLRGALQFFNKFIKAIQQLKPIPRSRIAKSIFVRDFYDAIANELSEIIARVSAVNLPENEAWGFHHNMIWTEVSDFRESSTAKRIVQVKLQRLLIKEIKNLTRATPSYLAAGVLGYCLYVMGLSVGDGRYRRDFVRFHRWVLAWTRKNYLTLHEAYPDVAKRCLVGSVQFEDAERRLVKTYASFFGQPGQREYLTLDPARPPAIDA
jgi:hypothetical protein